MSEKESPEHSPAPATPQSDSAVPSSPGPEVLTSPVSLQVPAAQSLPLPTVQNIDQPSILPPVQSPPRPPDVFIPKDLSYDGLMYFAAWLQDQGKITNEQFNYLHKTAQQYRKTQEELNQSYQRMDAARRALDIPGGVLPPPQPTGPPAPSQAEQLVNLMTALAAASQQPKEEPHSYLIRKGDQSEIEEMKAREEAARKPGVVSTSGTLAAGPISREEMERQRRERYEQLQRSNEEAARRKEEAERRARALDAMWRNDGSSSIGKP